MGPESAGEDPSPTPASAGGPQDLVASDGTNTANATYVVTLEATDKDGGTGTTSQTIAVTGPVYTDAQAFADWSGAAEDATPAPAVRESAPRP